MKLDLPDLPYLATGCALFGGGGGGEPRLGELMAMAALEDHGPIDLLEPSALPSDGIVLPVAMIGAPTVGVEKLPRGDEGQRLRERVEEILGRTIVALLPGELGGINGVIPVAWAARAGLPLVDADLIGRAFPGVQYTVPALTGMDPAPIVMVDERGNTVVLDVVDAAWANRFTAANMVAAGALMGMSIYPMSVAELDQRAVVGSVSGAIRAGRLLAESGGADLAATIDHLGGRLLFNGKLSEIDRRTENGLAMGSAIIDGLGPDHGSLLRLEFQNENLVAIREGEVIASVPDIITVVEDTAGLPIVTESLRYGQRVKVVSLPCAPIWTSPEGLRTAGPRAFGYDFDFSSSVEEASHARG